MRGGNIVLAWTFLERDQDNGTNAKHVVRKVDTLPAPASALLVYNSRASRSAGSIGRAFTRLSGKLDVTLTECPGCASELAVCRELMQRVDRIVVAGGDGTLHRVLPLLLGADRPVAVLPLGTANDFARSAGLPSTLEEACEIAISGTVRRVDVGRINGHPFLNVASVGLASAVTRSQTAQRKRTWRIASYALALADAVRRRRPFRGEIVSSAGVISGIFLQASFGNGRYHGGGLLAGPEATLDDGLLHVYTIAAKQWWGLIPVVPCLALGLHKWSGAIRTLSADRVVLQTTRPRTITADGEIIGTTEGSVEVGVARRALCIAVPSA